MFNNHYFSKPDALGGALLAAFAISGCAVALPPAPASNPADPVAASAAHPPLRSSLLATSRSYISPQAGSHAHEMTREPAQPARAKPANAMETAYYTCPMHPEIREAGPDECPICGMTLTRKTDAQEGAKP